MALSYVLDEHLRGRLWHAIQSHNARGPYLIDAVCVGDLPDLPLGSPDPDILAWAESKGRILVSRDETTMKTYLAEHLQARKHSPGLFLVRKSSLMADVVFFLAAAAHASDPADWQDRFVYIP